MYVQKYFVSINKQLLQNLIILMNFRGSSAGEKEGEGEKKRYSRNKEKKGRTERYMREI